MLGFLRFIQLLAIAVWVGGLAFFAFVLAPTAFHVLPSVHEAGLIVGSALKVFDNVELGCGALFLAVTAEILRRAPVRIKGRYGIEFLLAGAMVLATAYLKWNVIPAMDNDQNRVGGDVNAVESTNPARMDFDRLHVRSEQVAGTVLVVGLGVLFLVSREQARAE